MRNGAVVHYSGNTGKRGRTPPYCASVDGAARSICAAMDARCRAALTAPLVV
jgi:hypothetical protein